jgi:hypothetical protein
MNLVQRTLAAACCMSGRYLGNYLVVLYMTTKLMYISISIFQIFLLSTMLGSNFAFYGIQVLYRLYRGERSFFTVSSVTSQQWHLVFV